MTTSVNFVQMKAKYSASSIFRPSINRPGSTGRYIQLFSLKSTRFTVKKKLFRLAFKLFCG